MAAIDCLQRERPVTAGSDDGSVRLWKVVQESQLVFTGHKYDDHYSRMLILLCMYMYKLWSNSIVFPSFKVL